jgi:hypothetical protein
VRGLQSHALVVLGAAIGAVVPDVDQAIPYLVHRSGLTHSILPALLLGRFFGPRLGAGALVGTAVALSDDLFPRAYQGFALIHLPFLGRIGLWTIPWLWLNVALSFLLLHRLDASAAEARAPWFLVALTLVLGFGYLVLKQWNLAAFVVLLATGTGSIYLEARLRDWRAGTAR